MFRSGLPDAAREELSYSEFLSAVDNRQVESVTLRGNRIYGRTADDRNFQTYAPEDPGLIERLGESGASIEARPPEGNGTLLSIFISWFPMLLLIGVWIFFMRQMQSGGGRAMGFGKSRARLLTERQGKVTFADVAGIDEAAQELEEVVEFLRDPQRFQRLGGKIPKGVLLVGPPGTGKTLLARAIAGEAGVPFFTISGSDFVEMFVGVGASRVRDMFEQGKKSAPCIVFIDEIDAVGRHRGAGLGGGNDEREQTLNQLLVEMDGFEANEGIILIAATNRPDVLDPALLRPGRFDRQVVVPNPDIGGREQILRVHTRKVPLAPNVNLKTVARGTPGFSGADLANLVNEAALVAARASKRFVTQADFEVAKDKVLMGAERRSLAMTEEEKELTAYHEAGHALVGLHVPGNDPLHKVTIIPRGRALGVTMSLPERDRYGLKRSEILARLAMMYGGRAAEELVFGADSVTTGASNDIQQATEMARRLVTEWGLSEALGAVRLSENQEEIFLGHSVARQQTLSEETARRIDVEIARILREAEETAADVLVKHREELERLAKGLLEYETLSAEEVDKVVAGEALSRGGEVRTAPPRASSIPGAAPEGGNEEAGADAPRSSRPGGPPRPSARPG